MELIYAIVGIVMLIFIMFYFLKKSKTNDKLKIESLFSQFKIASERKDIFEINRLGKELVYNNYFTKNHLEFISSIVETHINSHLELKDLQKLILNKRLFWQGGAGQ